MSPEKFLSVHRQPIEIDERDMAVSLKSDFT